MDSKQIREEENFRKKIFNIIQIGDKSNPASRASVFIFLQRDYDGFV